ncbi:MAG: RecX family transcriptional regulator [Rhodanobacteraceae bacterium]
MKRRDLLRHLTKHGCLLLREGARHSWWQHPASNRRSAIPRHSEINDHLARKVCRELGLPPVKRRSNRDARGKAADRSAYDRALGMLARREYSQRELRARLEHAGCDEGESETALRKLREQKYQDDDRFGEMVMRARVAQGYGPARIRVELRSHGLADSAIRALLEAADTDWTKLARAQLCKKYSAKPAADHAERGKRAAFLLRRGFAAATIGIVIHSDVETPDD